jgi:hypothetical protein
VHRRYKKQNATDNSVAFCFLLGRFTYPNSFCISCSFDWPK